MDLTVLCNRKIMFLSSSILLDKILVMDKGLINDPKRKGSKLVIHPQGEKEFNRVVQQKDHVLVVF